MVSTSIVCREWILPLFREQVQQAMSRGGGRIKGYNSYNQAQFAWEYSSVNGYIAPDPGLLPYPFCNDDQVPVELPRGSRPSRSSAHSATSSVSGVSTNIPPPTASISTGPARSDSSRLTGSSRLAGLWSSRPVASVSSGPAAGPSQPRTGPSTRSRPSGEGDHFWVITRGRQPGVYWNLWVISSIE